MGFGYKGELLLLRLTVGKMPGNKKATIDFEEAVKS